MVRRGALLPAKGPQGQLVVVTTPITTFPGGSCWVMQPPHGPRGDAGYRPAGCRAVTMGMHWPPRSKNKSTHEVVIQECSCSQTPTQASWVEAQRGNHIQEAQDPQTSTLSPPRAALACPLKSAQCSEILVTLSNILDEVKGRRDYWLNILSKEP